MTFPSPTGEPIYDIGILGMVLWAFTQGYIVIRTRNNGKNIKPIEPCPMHVKELSKTLTEVGNTMKAIADNQNMQTELLKRNDERHSSRGKLCALSDENTPTHVQRIIDFPQKVSVKLEEHRHELSKVSGKVGDIQTTLAGMKAE